MDAAAGAAVVAQGVVFDESMSVWMGLDKFYHPRVPHVAKMPPKLRIVDVKVNAAGCVEKGPHPMVIGESTIVRVYPAMNSHVNTFPGLFCIFTLL